MTPNEVRALAVACPLCRAPAWVACTIDENKTRRAHQARMASYKPRRPRPLAR